MPRRSLLPSSFSYSPSSILSLSPHAPDGGVTNLIISAQQRDFSHGTFNAFHHNALFVRKNLAKREDLSTLMTVLSFLVFHVPWMATFFKRNFLAILLHYCEQIIRSIRKCGRKQVGRIRLALFDPSLLIRAFAI